MERLIKVLVLTVLVLVALANAALFAAIKFTQDPAPRPLDGQRIFEASRPAVMLIQANYAVKVSLPEATLPKASQDRLDQELIAMVRAGRLSLQAAAIDQAAVNLLLDNPDAYFVPGPTRFNDDVSLVSSGTGFFATEDGYLITAAHVVSASKEDLRALITELEKKPARLAAARTEVQRLVREESGVTLNDSQLDKLISWQGRWVDKYATVDKVDATYYLASGSAVQAGQNLLSTGTRLSLVTAEPIAPGRDIAVMKADVTSVPALALATGTPSTGAAAYVVGYPRRGYLEEAAHLDATVTPTLSRGTLQDQRSMEGGWTAYGTSAQVTHGNSGGPVLDGQGRVLGVVSFMLTNKEDAVDGPGFFVPVDIVRETLTKAAVKPAAGTLTSLYYQALSQDDFRHYRHELAILSQVQTRSAWHPYVRDAVATTQSAVLTGRDQTPPELSRYQPAGLGALGIATLLSVATILGLQLRRRLMKAPAVAPPAETTTSVASPDLELIAAVPELGASPNGAEKETIPIA
jgi:S1-C subfamily serine protease